jgi:hypothetical protein
VGWGAGRGRPDAKKVGGKEAVASVEPGGPREAAQVSGFRGAGNNSLYIANLKGPSNEIDFKNLTKIYSTRPTKGHGWFLNFLGAPMILFYYQKTS